MSQDFTGLFNEWARTYDQTVYGQHEQEYKEVFEKYDEILKAVVDQVKGEHVLEFGVGTGNLTRKLINRGFQVFGVEPSEEMLKIAQVKVPEAKIMDGDFLNFPQVNKQIDAVVSSYAFHHLMDKEKEQAIEGFSKLLKPGGRIVFADTVFKSSKARKEIIAAEIAAYHDNLVDDLMTEYYTFLDVLKEMCERHHFQVTFEQMNKYVWVMVAEKLE